MLSTIFHFDSCLILPAIQLKCSYEPSEMKGKIIVTSYLDITLQIRIAIIIDFKFTHGESCLAAPEPWTAIATTLDPHGQQQLPQTVMERGGIDAADLFRLETTWMLPSLLLRESLDEVQGSQDLQSTIATVQELKLRVTRSCKMQSSSLRWTVDCGIRPLSGWSWNK